MGLAPRGSLLPGVSFPSRLTALFSSRCLRIKQVKPPEAFLTGLEGREPRGLSSVEALEENAREKCSARTKVVISAVVERTHSRALNIFGKDAVRKGNH